MNVYVGVITTNGKPESVIVNVDKEWVADEIVGKVIENVKAGEWGRALEELVEDGYYEVNDKIVLSILPTKMF